MYAIEYQFRVSNQPYSIHNQFNDFILHIVSKLILEKEKTTKTVSMDMPVTLFCDLYFKNYMTIFVFIGAKDRT